MPTPRHRPTPTCPPGAAAPLGRRRLLGRALGWPLAALAGCAAPWPEVPAGPGSSSALARLQESAAAHGLAAWRRVQDLNLGLQHQPGSATGAAAVERQLRWLPQQGLLAWHESTPPAPQHGWRRWANPAAKGSSASAGADQGELRLWQAGAPVSDGALLLHTARQIDLLALLLLGPMALADTRGPVNWAEPATLDGRRCDQLMLDALPGLGGQGVSRLALFIDREAGLMRRLRLMSMAEQGQPGAMAATWDLPEPVLLSGLYWPRRCHRIAPSRSTGPAPAVWQLLGLDLDRGYSAADLGATQFSAAAAPPAAALPKS